MGKLDLSLLINSDTFYEKSVPFTCDVGNFSNPLVGKLRYVDQSVGSGKDLNKCAEFSDLADNALYWSGECRYARKEYAEAIGLFKQVLEKYPQGSKVPDALLKIGLAYISTGDKKNARVYLKKTVSQYPFTPAGTKAEKKLKQL